MLFDFEVKGVIVLVIENTIKYLIVVDFLEYFFNWFYVRRVMVVCFFY